MKYLCCFVFCFLSLDHCIQPFDESTTLPTTSFNTFSTFCKMKLSLTFIFSMTYLISPRVKSWTALSYFRIIQGQARLHFIVNFKRCPRVLQCIVLFVFFTREKLLEDEGEPRLLQLLSILLWIQECACNQLGVQHLTSLSLPTSLSLHLSVMMMIMNLLMHTLLHLPFPVVHTSSSLSFRPSPCASKFLISQCGRCCPNFHKENVKLDLVAIQNLRLRGNLVVLEQLKNLIRVTLDAPASFFLSSSHCRKLLRPSLIFWKFRMDFTIK